MSVGYSGTPLAKKLGIKEGSLVLVVNPPDNYIDLLSPVPAGVRFVGMPDDPPWPPDEVDENGFDIIHLFTNSRDELFMELSESVRHLKKNGAFWVSWYKKAARLPTEITEDTVREACLPIGLVDVKVCAVDEKWSGLKLVIRKRIVNSACVLCRSPGATSVRFVWFVVTLFPVNRDADAIEVQNLTTKYTNHTKEHEKIIDVPYNVELQRERHVGSIELPSRSSSEGAACW